MRCYRLCLSVCLFVCVFLHVCVCLCVADVRNVVYTSEDEHDMLSPLSLPDDVIVVDTQPLTSASPIRRVFDRTRLGTSLSLSLSLSLYHSVRVYMCLSACLFFYLGP